MTINRRRFVIGLAAAAAATPLRRAWSAGDSADVLIIGAGLSGLNAALLLEELGASVILLEGRRRVGGKMLTFADVPGQPEAGGASMGAGYGRMLDAAKLGGIEVYDVLGRPGAGAVAAAGAAAGPGPGVALALDGAILTPQQWRDSPRNPFVGEARAMLPWQYVPGVIGRANPLQAIEDWFAPKNAALDVSMYEFLRAQGASDAMIELCYDTNTSYGNNAHDVSALMMFFVDAFGKAQTKLQPVMLKARGGNDRIPRAMAGRLKSPVRFGQIAVGVVGDASGVTVHTSTGARYRGKSTICAMPFSTLRHLRLDPVLPGPQARAVKTLPHQMITQIALNTTRPFWEQDGQAASMWTDSPIGRVSAINDDAGRVASLLVTAYGPKASYLDRLGLEAAGRYAIAEIERYRPAAKGCLSVAALHSWGLDPFSAGDWAYFAPGTVTQFMPAMFQPHGRVHFCGEQTAVAARGMEGAMESGERVALEVASSL